MRLVVDAEWRPAVLGGPLGVHSDILAGRDCELGWEDVFGGKFSLRAYVPLPRLSLTILAGREFRLMPDFHSEMERRLGMNW
jgi:hypothetical protein